MYFLGGGGGIGLIESACNNVSNGVNVDKILAFVFSTGSTWSLCCS